MKKRFLFLILSALLLTACNLSEPGTSSGQSGNNTTNPLDGGTYSGTYYNSIKSDLSGNLTGNDLKLKLRSVIAKNHKMTTYSQITSLFVKSDKSNKSGNIITFYAHADINGKWDSGNTYNREHVWPKANGWFQESGAGADLHHIRPTITDINSARGNKKFADLDEKNSSVKPVNSNGYLGGYSNNSYFEPLDHAKGDVARIIFYLVTRYSEADSTAYSIARVATGYPLLLKWNKLDPVDQLEINRNNYVYTVQNNRNPFIDYPGLADAIWNKK